MKIVGAYKLKVSPATENIPSNGRHVALSRFIHFKIPTKTTLILPRSGRYFVEALSNINFANKKVLDIGTGYFGYLSKHAVFFGAKNITAVDINRDAVDFAKKRYYSKFITYQVGDVYSSIAKGGNLI